MSEVCFESQSMTESQMVKSTLQGNLDAFNQLVIAYQDIAFNLAYRLIGEGASAEDIVQEAFLSAYQQLHTFRYGSFKSWLLRIVTNACYDEMRRWKRQPLVYLTAADGDQDIQESWICLRDPGETPEEISLNSELNSAIQKGLISLDVEFRSVIILVDILEMGYAEAAQILDVPIGTVKSRLLRARARMRYSISGYLNAFQGFPN